MSETGAHNGDMYNFLAGPAPRRPADAWKLYVSVSAGLRAGADLHALGWHTSASRDYMAKMREGVKAALDARDGAFGDYRTGKGE